MSRDGWPMSQRGDVRIGAGRRTRRDGEIVKKATTPRQGGRESAPSSAGHSDGGKHPQPELVIDSSNSGPRGSGDALPGADRDGRVSGGEGGIRLGRAGASVRRSIPVAARCDAEGAREPPGEMARPAKPVRNATSARLDRSSLASIRRAARRRSWRWYSLGARPKAARKDRHAAYRLQPAATGTSATLRFRSHAS